MFKRNIIFLHKIILKKIAGYKKVSQIIYQKCTLQAVDGNISINELIYYIS